MGILRSIVTAVNDRIDKRAFFLALVSLIVLFEAMSANNAGMSTVRCIRYERAVNPFGKSIR